MIDCPKCKATIEDDSWYCDQCGQELKVCPQCGTYGKGNRCTQCGTVLVTAKQKAEGSNVQNVTPPPHTTPTPTPNQVPTVHPPVSEVNVESTIRRPSESPKPTMLVLVNRNAGIRLQVLEGAIIGRRNGPYALVLASQAYISGTHARFNSTPMGWTITDMDSTNGTFYNNIKLQPNVTQLLKIGAKVTIADLDLIVEAE